MRRRRRGQTISQYAILLGLVAAMVIPVAMQVGCQVKDTHTTVVMGLDAGQAGQLPPPAADSDDEALGAPPATGEGGPPAPSGPDEYGDGPPDFPGD